MFKLEAAKPFPNDIIQQARRHHKNGEEPTGAIKFYEERKGSGIPGPHGALIECRSCGEEIQKDEPYLFLHHAPDEKNEWALMKGGIHIQCTAHKCPRCKQPFGDWAAHKAKCKGMVAASLEDKIAAQYFNVTASKWKKPSSPWKTSYQEQQDTIRDILSPLHTVTEEQDNPERAAQETQAQTLIEKLRRRFKK